MADRMLPPSQLRGQGPRALANPAQRGLRIAARFRIDQAVQRGWQAGIMGEDFLASSPRPPDASGRRHRSLLHFPQALGDGFARKAAGAADLRHAAMTQGPSFAGGRKAPCPFIQERPEGGEFLLELSERFHAPESYTLPAEYATLIYLRLLS